MGWIGWVDMFGVGRFGVDRVGVDRLGGQVWDG